MVSLGEDATKAARRAVREAIGRTSLPGVRRLIPSGDRADMRVDVRVAVPGHEAVRADEVAAEFPYGRVTDGGGRRPEDAQRHRRRAGGGPPHLRRRRRAGGLVATAGGVPALSCTGVTKSFPGDVIALAGLDLEVPEGAFLGLLGPNGAGKTTLIRSVVGLTRPSGGGIRVFGDAPWGEGADRARRAIGYAPRRWPWTASCRCASC